MNLPGLVQHEDAENKNTMIYKAIIIGISVIFFALVVLDPKISFADDTDKKRIAELEGQVSNLNDKIERLTNIVNQLVSRQQRRIPGIPPIDSTITAKAEIIPPKLNIHGFGHVQYDIKHHDNADGTEDSNNNFTNGGVNLFITSKISNKISFLNETIFEFGENGANTLDVERVSIKYEVSDKLNISAGRGHTALGFWNERYHHGTWLQTTTDRPKIYAFEDAGGILPVHFVGLKFSGDLDAPGGTFSYVSNLANGRGTIGDEVQITEDDNDSKMASILFTYEPFKIEGLGIGANYLYDKIPEKLGTINRGAEIDEQIAGVHLFYITDPYEIILEGVRLDHYNHDNGNRDITLGGYVQLAYTWDKYKPYFRFDWLSIPTRDAFFEDTIEDSISYTAGLRYELTSYNALKFEFRHIDEDTSRSDEFTIQSAFAF